MDLETEEPALLQVVALSRGGGQFSGRLANPDSQYEVEFEFDPATRLSRVILLPPPGKFIRPSVVIAPVIQGDQFVLPAYPDRRDPAERHLYRELKPAGREGLSLYLGLVSSVRSPKVGQRLQFEDARGTPLTMRVLTEGDRDIVLEFLK